MRSAGTTDVLSPSISSQETSKLSLPRTFLCLIISNRGHLTGICSKKCSAQTVEKNEKIQNKSRAQCFDQDFDPIIIESIFKLKAESAKDLLPLSFIPEHHDNTKTT